jgi:dTMP kinase
MSEEKYVKIMPRVIALEGTDGVGKSTQRDKIESVLAEAGLDHICERLPGGTEYGEYMRSYLKTKDLDPEIQTHAMISTMLALYKEKILPALAAGKWVLLDRWLMSTLIYQGLNKGVSMDYILTNYQAALGNFQPDFYMVLNAEAATIQARLRMRNEEPDKLEPIDKDTMTMCVGYASAESFTPFKRALIPVDANPDLDEVSKDVEAIVKSIIVSARVTDA